MTLSFSPDANFPLINAEKGRLYSNFEREFAAGGAGPRLVSMTGGTRPNVVPDKAEAVFEGEFAGAVFGAVCGLMWDWLAGRTVGMLALELLLLCFAVSAVVQLYFKNSAANFALIASAAALLVLTLDWLFFYYMPGYSGAASRWLWFVLPTAVLSVPVCFPLFGVVRRIHEEFKIDNGVV